MQIESSTYFEGLRHLDMKEWVCLFCILLVFTGCKGEDEVEKSFVKADDSGMQFKIYETGAGNKVKPGQFLKMHVKQVYLDSVLFDTRFSIPQYQQIDSLYLSPEAYQIFGQVRNGDSLEFRVPADTAFKNSKSMVSKGGFLNTYVKVLSIFDSEEEMKVDYEMEKSRGRQDF